MERMLRIAPLVAAGFVVTVLARGAGAIGEVSWIAPTPSQGARFAVRTGGRIDFQLAANHPGGSTVQVRIRTPAVPAGAIFRPQDGNPATATFAWQPTAVEVGSYSLTFTASAYL